MSDLIALLETRRRHRLLMRAARFGVELYHRETYLPRLLGNAVLPPRRAAAMRLMILEQACEEARLSCDEMYSPARHIEIMTALVCEASASLQDCPAPTETADRARLCLVV